MYPPQASFVDDVWISVWYGPLPIVGVTVAVSCVTCVQLYVYVVCAVRAGACGDVLDS